MLEELFGRTERDDLAHATESVKAALELRNKEAAEEAAKHVGSILKDAEQKLSVSVKNLRRLRQQEKTHKELVDNWQRALSYFVETGNPLPLVSLGLYVPALNDAIYLQGINVHDKKHQIPKDWQPKSS